MFVPVSKSKVANLSRAATIETLSYIKKTLRSYTFDGENVNNFQHE